MRRTTYEAFIAALLATSLLTACASLTQEQCVSTDWHALGKRDATLGFPSSKLYDHMKSCEKFHVAIDFEAYQKGYELGLQYYCTPESAYTQGKNGQYLSSICPSHNNHLQTYNEIGRAIALIRTVQNQRVSLLRDINKTLQSYDPSENKLKEIRRLVAAYTQASDAISLKLGEIENKQLPYPANAR